MNTNAKNHTLDLFTHTSHTPPRATPSAAPEPAPHEGDGLGLAVSPETELPRKGLPALADTELTVPRPFRVPGLRGEVLPVPVFRVQLVRERDHLTRQVTTPADAARLCSELLDGLDREVFLVVAMSVSNRVIGAHAAHQGTVDASIASPREALKFCLLCNARSFLIAHNHPSGSLEPSKADVQVSKQMQQAGEVVGVRLLDSLVIGFDQKYTSLSERGLL